MSGIECNCAWNPDSHADTCPVYLHAECERLNREAQNLSGQLGACDRKRLALIAELKTTREAFMQMRNAAAGYSNYCEDSANTRRCDRDFAAADELYQSAAPSEKGDTA